MTNKLIAQTVNVSENTVALRIRRLIQDKVIRISIARDTNAEGYRLHVFANIQTDMGRTEDVAKQLAAFRAFHVVVTTLGNSEVLLMFFTKDYDTLATAIDEVSRQISGIKSISIDVASEIFKFSTTYGMLDNV